MVAESSAAPLPGAVGVLGGSGLYQMEGLRDVREIDVVTPFGPPSAPPVVGTLAGRPLIFIPRHGRGHRLLPSEINYRANIHALKQLGAERVISVSAVGSLRAEIRPGDFVLVDQFIDRTHLRASTFFGDGCVGHVGLADPVCVELCGFLDAAGRATAPQIGARAIHRGGTYLCMEGPQFSTRAESNQHRAGGAAVIGMTGVTEAKLAREAELCFALLALATDYDCWHEGHAAVSVASVVNVLRDNVAGAQDVLRRAVLALPVTRNCGCGTAAEHAIMTDPKLVPHDTRERLATLYGRYLG